MFAPRIKYAPKAKKTTAGSMSSFKCSHTLSFTGKSHAVQTAPPLHSYTKCPNVPAIRVKMPPVMQNASMRLLCTII